MQYEGGALEAKWEVLFRARTVCQCLQESRGRYVFQVDGPTMVSTPSTRGDTSSLYCDLACNDTRNYKLLHSLYEQNAELRRDAVFLHQSFPSLADRLSRKTSRSTSVASKSNKDQMNEMSSSGSLSMLDAILQARAHEDEFVFFI